MHLLITLEWLLIIITIIIIIVVVVIVFTGYGGFAVVNTTVVVVEKNIPVLFKIEFYSNSVLNLYIFWIMIKNRIDKYNSEDEKISISLFYQCCDNYF